MKEPTGRAALRQRSAPDDRIGALRDGQRLLKNQHDFSGEWESLGRRAGELSEELAVFRDGIPENYVSWIERRGRGIFLEACPIDVSGMLREYLFSRVPTCVLTSATLTVGQSFQYIRRRIGFGEGAEFAEGKGARGGEARVGPRH